MRDLPDLRLSFRDAESPLSFACCSPPPSRPYHAVGAARPSPQARAPLLGFSKTPLRRVLILASTPERSPALRSKVANLRRVPPLPFFPASTVCSARRLQVCCTLLPILGFTSFGRLSTLSREQGHPRCLPFEAFLLFHRRTASPRPLPSRCSVHLLVDKEDEPQPQGLSLRKSPHLTADVAADRGWNAPLGFSSQVGSRTSRLRASPREGPESGLSWPRRNHAGAVRLAHDRGIRRLEVDAFRELRVPMPRPP